MSKSLDGQIKVQCRSVREIVCNQVISGRVASKSFSGISTNLSKVIQDISVVVSFISQIWFPIFMSKNQDGQIEEHRSVREIVCNQVIRGWVASKSFSGISTNPSKVIQHISVTWFAGRPSRGSQLFTHFGKCLTIVTRVTIIYTFWPTTRIEKLQPLCWLISPGGQPRTLLIARATHVCATECDIRIDFDTNEYPNIFV